MTHQATISRSRGLAARSAACCVSLVASFVVAIGSGQIRADENTIKAEAQPTKQQEIQTKNSGPAAVGQRVPPSGRIQYVGPDTYILLDSEGRPQPVPGMTYEDFLAAWKKMNGTANSQSQPRFTIESIKIDGSVHRGRAELKFEAVVHLRTEESADVPLGLVGAILQGDPRFGPLDPASQKSARDASSEKSNASSDYLYYDPHRGGFVAHMSPHAADRRSLSLDLIVPVTREGVETTLPLSIPQAVSSSLKLEVDAPTVAARASNGTVVSEESMSDGRTRVEVAGFAGQFRLAWQSSNSAESVASTLNAAGAIRVTIDGRGARSDARLTVQSIGGNFDRFRVKLPRGTKLVRSSSAAGGQDAKYRISDEAPTSASKSAAESSAQTVLVELKEKQQGPVVVELSTEQLTSQPNAGQPLELAGFEVLGAVRQFGDVALNVANDWQARWDSGRSIRQIDRTELDSSLQRADITAAFQYDRQPWSLPLHVSRRQSRVYVKPQYELELLPEEARLNVQLGYQVFGARAFEFRVDLDGWEMSGEPVESGGLVDQDRISLTPEGTLLLPLTQASSRKAEISFSLRRPVGRDVSNIRLRLPVPLADSVGTGELIVRAAPGIDLQPDVANSTGIAVAPAAELGGTRGSSGLGVTHFRSLLPNAIFAATRTNRARETAVQVITQVNIGPDSAQIDERMEYVVEYEPIKELILEAATDVPTTSDSLQIAMLAGGDENSEIGEQRTPLQFEIMAGDTEYPEQETRRLRVALPQPRIGKFTIGVRFRIPRSQPSATDGTSPVPLLTPMDGHLKTERVVVSPSRGNTVTLATRSEGSSWKTVEPQGKNSPAGGRYEFVADRAETSLPLAIRATESNVAATTIVERVWLQTWISAGVEQDRAAFRFRTTGSETTVELPPDTSPGDVEVLLDGQPANVASPAAGRIVVRLPDAGRSSDINEANAATHTLELRSRRPIQQWLITRHFLTPPQIDGVSQLSQIYWQIVLPADEHIVKSPNQLASASEWQWLGTFCGRRSAMTQTELEQWSGASAQVAPGSADSQYLFTGLLPLSSIMMETAPRWLIVLIASSLTLALVASYFYLPAPARRWMLLATVFVLAAAAMTYPTAALLIAQAAAIGVVLAPISALVSRLMARPRRWAPAPSVAASSQRMLTPRAESIVVPSVMAAASTAPTASLRLSDSQR